MGKHPSTGFTLIELLITISIAAILLGVGVPSFVEMVRASRIGAQQQSLVGALYLARSEAVKRAEIVTVCARKKNGRDCGDDWADGFVVFTDRDGTPGDTVPTIAATDTVLLVGPPFEGGNAVGAYAVKSGTSNRAGARYVRYLPSGSTEWSVGSVRICDSDGREAHSRVINIALTGDIRPGRKDAEGRPIDAFGRAISCA